MTTLHQSTPKARKPHTCDWCGEVIEKGERYSKWAGMFNNEFQHNKMHLDCAEIYTSKENDYGHDGYNRYENKRGSLEER